MNLCPSGREGCQHNIPKSHVRRGDYYAEHCQATTWAVSNKLSWPQIQVKMSYQSRLGGLFWLKPHTESFLRCLPAKGFAHLAVGGKRFYYIPALNALPLHIELLHALVTDIL